MSKIEPKDEHKYLTQLSLSGCQCDKTSRCYCCSVVHYQRFYNKFMAHFQIQITLTLSLSMQQDYSVIVVQQSACYEADSLIIHVKHLQLVKMLERSRSKGFKQNVNKKASRLTGQLEY